MPYSLVEQNYLRGHGAAFGFAGWVGDLPFEDCDRVNTYIVRHDGVDLAEFDGRDAWRVKAWLVNHADYDGRGGVHTWEGRAGR